MPSKTDMTDETSSQASETPTITDVSAGDNDQSEPRLDDNGVAKMSSVLPTMWFGAQSGRYTIKLYNNELINLKILLKY